MSEAIEPVYDIKVRDGYAHEFYANGVLVHNCNWVPKSRGGKDPSPNDIDALVWSVRELETAIKHETSVATSKRLLSQLHHGTGRLSSRVA